MTRSAEQKGLPFEPRTVQMKSDLRGAGRIALLTVAAACVLAAVWLLRKRPAQ